MTVAFLTLGCKVNHYETEVMAQAFEAAGYRIVPFDEVADVYVVNTCTVTATGDKKSRQALRAAKRRNPAATVAAVGCYAQIGEKDLLAMPEIDLVLGNLHKPELPELLRQHVSESRRSYVEDISKERTFEPMSAVRDDRTRAVIKIQDGCNNFCTYCIIPYARGRIRSKPPQEALQEFRTLIAEGYREIILTGIEIASYGDGQGEDFTLLQLLDSLCKAACLIPNVRIRLGSLEPRVVTEEFADFLAEHPEICPQFHLSLQSGCDAVLTRMNRKYDTARFLRSVSLLRDRLPSVMLTTDVIVGFPGETPDQFRETLDFVTGVRFLKVHVFPYSRRTGTPAARMPDQIDSAEKSARAKALSEACDAVRREILEEQVGKTVLFLPETRENGVYSGYSENYLPIRLAAPEGLEGCMTRVTLTRRTGDALEAQCVKE